MIGDKIYVLKKDTSIQEGMDFPRGTEFHIVMDVVYMQGFPVQTGLQGVIKNWILNNPKLFTEKVA